MIDWWNATAVRCHGKPDGWRWHGLDGHDAPEGYTQVIGSVPIGVFAKGPRKGRTKWAKTSEVIWMKDADIEETKMLWSESTGKCSTCCGDGEIVKSVSVTRGTQMQQCKKCEGTGAANND